ncbi:MAG: C10 family peptidase [Candidatus Azobacteroides sp.]|nr:C10 family peptidase [Candidatus Azobacteroides sp.]
MNKKRLLWLGTLWFGLVFYSCNQLDFEEDFSSNADKEKAENSVSDPTFNVSLNSARCLVDILNKDQEEDQKKEVLKIQPIVYQKDTLLYIVNYQDNKGWLVISGDKRTSNILAYSDEGSFDLKAANPGVGIWTDDLAEQIYALKCRTTAASDTLSENYILWKKIEEYEAYQVNSQSQLRIAALEKSPDPTSLVTPAANANGPYWELYDMTVTISLATKGPLLAAKWGQWDPWNTCVPAINSYSTKKCPTGCVAVAGAQMLYYLHYKLGVPASMYSAGYCTGYSVGSGNKNYAFGFSNATTTTWDLMAKSKNGTSTDRVAILMGYIGMQIGMDYSKDASGAKSEDLVGFFSNQGIKCNYTDYNSSSVMTSLTNNMPVIMRADAKRNSHGILGIDLWYTYEGGHSWVVDGYERQQTQYTEYYRWVDPSKPSSPLRATTPAATKTVQQSTTMERLIMNWGWNGDSDAGRYTLGIEDKWNGDGSDYQWRKQMIINFAKK